MRDFEEPEKTRWLPSGKTCSDCKWFESKCSWHVARGHETYCYFEPNRFTNKGGS